MFFVFIVVLKKGSQYEMMTNLLCFDVCYKLDHRIPLCKVSPKEETNMLDLDILG